MDRLTELCQLIKARKSALPANLPFELIPNDWQMLSAIELTEWHELRMSSIGGSSEEAKARNLARVTERKRGRNKTV